MMSMMKLESAMPISPSPFTSARLRMSSPAVPPRIRSMTILSNLNSRIIKHNQINIFMNTFKGCYITIYITRQNG